MNQTNPYPAALSPYFEHQPLAFSDGHTTASDPPSSSSERIKKERPTCPHGSVSTLTQGKRRERCRACGGSSFCKHYRIKYQCKDCKLGSMCNHGKQKSLCIQCCGSHICTHGRSKYQCNTDDCHGTSVCSHGRRKNQVSLDVSLTFKCRDCGGSSICEHSRRKYDCGDCRGKGYVLMD
jgi:hypothetical protein